MKPRGNPSGGAGQGVMKRAEIRRCSLVYNELIHHRDKYPGYARVQDGIDLFTLPIGDTIITFRRNHSRSRDFIETGREAVR